MCRDFEIFQKNSQKTSLSEAEADFCLFLCWLWPYVISYIVSSTMKLLKQLDVATTKRNIPSKSRVGGSSSLA